MINGVSLEIKHKNKAEALGKIKQVTAAPSEGYCSFSPEAVVKTIARKMRVI